MLYPTRFASRLKSGVVTDLRLIGRDACRPDNTHYIALTAAERIVTHLSLDQVTATGSTEIFNYREMRMKPSFLLITLTIFAMLGGCASSPRIPYQDISYPEINKQTTAYLGDRLLEQGRGFYTNVVHVDKLVGKYGVISAGDYCRLPDSDEYFNFSGKAIVYYNFVGGLRGYDNSLTYKAETNEVCLDDMWSGCFDTSFGKIVLEKNALCSDPTSFQRIIEYNGKAGDVLNFTYREFYGNRMNSAFTTNFTMDQKAGDTLTYKGAVLKVFNATNQQIDYTVVRNFNEAR